MLHWKNKWENPWHLPENTVIMSGAGYRGIRGTDGQIYIRLTGLCIYWLWFFEKERSIIHIAMSTSTKSSKSFIVLYNNKLLSDSSTINIDILIVFSTFCAQALLFHYKQNVDWDLLNILRELTQVPWEAVESEQLLRYCIQAALYLSTWICFLCPSTVMV